MNKYEWTIARAEMFEYDAYDYPESTTLDRILHGHIVSNGFVDKSSLGDFSGNTHIDLQCVKCHVEIIPEEHCVEIQIPKESIPDSQCDLVFKTLPARILIDFENTNNRKLQPCTEYPIVQVRIVTPDGYCELTIVKYPSIPDDKIPFFRSRRIQATVEFKHLVTWEHVHTWLTENFALDNGFDWDDANLTITPINDSYRDVCDVWVIETDYSYHMIK